jgi:NAD(P)H-flavin reductase
MAARPQECRAHVAAVRGLTPHILESDLTMDDPPALAFEAGQWVSIPFGPKTVRAYSIASTPRSPRQITLTADVAPSGIGSEWFRALRPGDEVRFKGPLGGFVFSRADGRRPLFVAEEIGIVPIRAILADLDETGFGRPATLLYWVRDPGWLVYDAEFRSLARRSPAFAYHPVAGEAPAGWAGERGEVADVVSRLASDVGGLVAYVSGGGAMINRVRDVLVGRGLDRKAVKWEKFW